MFEGTRRVAATLAMALALTSGGAANARADVDLWPLLEVDGDDLTVMYPLYVREGEFRMAFPWYMRTNEGRDDHYLWPLVKLSEGRLERVAPVYFSATDGEFALLPFIVQKPDFTLWLLPPIYRSKTDDFAIVFPLWARGTDYWFAAPNLYARYEGDTMTRLGSFGLFDMEWRGDERDLSALLLGSARWGGDETAVGLFPLFSFERGPEEQWLQIANVALSRTPEKRRFDIWPVFETDRSADAWAVRSLIAGWVDGPGYRGRWLTPFFETSHEERASGEIIDRWSLLAYAYTRRETRSADGALLERYRRFLVFSDRLARDGSRVFSLLGIPVRERTAAPAVAPAEPPQPSASVAAGPSQPASSDPAPPAAPPDAPNLDPSSPPHDARH